MSKIILNHLSAGFTQIYYDEHYCGILDDREETRSVSEVIRKIIHFSGLEIEVKEVRDAVTKKDLNA